jgi:hypothetical protein
MGEVITSGQLKRHRERAGLRIGDAHHVDLARYIAWLVQLRHARNSEATKTSDPSADLMEVALGAAEQVTSQDQEEGKEPEFTSKQVALIAALITERSNAAAAAKTGVKKSTMYRWLRQPRFRAVCRAARRKVVESGVGRTQVATVCAVDTLTHVARHGRRESDRVRASIAILEIALKGVHETDLLAGERVNGNAAPMGTSDVVMALSSQIQETRQSNASPAEKARLIATLCDSILRAIGVDVVDKRLEALQSVLGNRRSPK